MISASDGLHLIGGTAGFASDGLHLIGGTAGFFDGGAADTGRGLLAHWIAPGNYTTSSIVPDATLAAGDNFGKCNPSLVSGANGIHLAIGGQVTDFGATPPPAGRAFLFLSNSSGVTQQSEITSSGAAATGQDFGHTQKLLSGSDQPLIFFVNAENQKIGTSVGDAGAINIYQTGSSIDTWTFITGSNGVGGRYGNGLDAMRYGTSIYIVAGEQRYPFQTAVNGASIGRGYLYKWDLVVSGS